MVCEGSQAVGMLDMTQILSAFSTHSHVLSLSIARANSVEELALASNRQQQLVDSLVTNGIRTRFMMELVSAVNEQIIERAFELVVPPAMHNHCCLVVMGSEGRGEQILKTDQDNALILEPGLEWPNQQKVLDELNHTLARLGYPLCLAKSWSATLTGYARLTLGNSVLMSWSPVPTAKVSWRLPFSLMQEQ